MFNEDTNSTQENATYPSLQNSSFSPTPGAATPSISDIIAFNDITSRANYVHSFFAGLGFLAGCFLIYSFSQTYRAHRQVAWLHRLLWVFCGFQMLLLLLSLHILVHRPKYMNVTALGCAALSFTINAALLCSLLVLVLMAYVLTFDPPHHTLMRKPEVCAPLVILSSTLICLLLAGLRGLQEGDCVMDPPCAGVTYAAAKLCLAFLIPYIFQLGILINGCVMQWKSEGRFLSGSEEGPVFLTISIVMFLCLLFYNVALVRGAQLVRNGQMNIHEKAFLSVSEGVLFSGSSISLVIVVFMHRPCRESLYGTMRQLLDWCQRPRRPQPNRNIIAPHIEITDTLQDIES